MPRKKSVVTLGEEPPLEQQQVEGSDRDAAVGEVEDRLEEDVASQQGDPVGPGPQREVEHIHDLAEKERRVVPDDTVEEAVDDVAEGAGGDERQADQHPCGDGRGLTGLPGRRILEAHAPDPKHQGRAQADAE